MGINIEFVVNSAIAHLEKDVRESLDNGGALKPGDVYVQFHTQEDDRVRPSHQALDGLVGAPGDPSFPVPPIDYGCRCFVSYHGVTGTPGAAFLPPPTKKPVDEAPVVAYAKALDEQLPDWRSIRDKVKGMRSFEATRLVRLAVKEALPDADSQEVNDLTRMVIQAQVS